MSRQPECLGDGESLKLIPSPGAACYVCGLVIRTQKAVRIKTGAWRHLLACTLEASQDANAEARAKDKAFNDAHAAKVRKAREARKANGKAPEPTHRYGYTGQSQYVRPPKAKPAPKTTPFPDKRYQVIVADPPWGYQNWTDSKNGAAASAYVTQDQAWIEGLPVAGLADPEGCVLLLWGTWPKLAEAMATIEAWGFDYITCAWVWCKVNRDATDYCGLGFYTRSGSEFCLLAKRGKCLPEVKDAMQVIHAPVGAHSVKPPEALAMAERMWPEAERIELFSRRRWPGWDAWGDQVEDAMPMYPEEGSGK